MSFQAEAQNIVQQELDTLFAAVTSQPKPPPVPPKQVTDVPPSVTMQRSATGPPAATSQPQSQTRPFGPTATKYR